MSIYGIYENKKSKKKLVYYPCPKNANTSAKLFFAKHLGVENKFIFLSDKIPRYKQTEADFLGKSNLNNFLPTIQPFSIVNVDYKCCLLRNPVERFVSAYKNRILFHKDRQFKDHTIDMVLDKLENGLYENRHFLAQTYFLGDNLNYYSFYADVNNIKYFEERVNEFFEKKIEFPKIQTRGKELDIKLSNQQLDRVRRIYIKDYILLKGSK